MKIYIVTGYAEYFYPKAVSSFVGLASEEGLAQVPDLSWMLNVRTPSVDRLYHTPMFAEGDDVATRAALLSSYLEDTTKPESPVALLFPDDSLSVSHRDHAALPQRSDPRAELTHVLRRRFGEAAVVLTRLSLGYASQLLIAQLANRHPPSHDPKAGPAHLACVPESPLFDAMRRNFTHNAVRLAMSSVLKTHDRVFEPGRRPTLIADALDWQGVRLKVDTTHDDLLRKCDELSKREWLFVPPLQTSSEFG